MKYELISPSDKIEFEAESNQIAFFCVVAISPAYGAKNAETGWTAGPFLLGISEETVEVQLGREIEPFCELYKDEINACLKSFH